MYKYPSTKRQSFKSTKIKTKRITYPNIFIRSLLSYYECSSIQNLLLGTKKYSKLDIDKLKIYVYINSKPRY